MGGYKKTVELLKQLIASKRNLADTLVGKGEEADFNEPFDTLVDKAANYTPKTYTLVDENGNEVTAVLVEEETIFDATANDIRKGKIAAGANGPIVGEKVIPSYTTTEGVRIVPNGSAFVIPLAEKYDFTKLQALFCPFTNGLDGSVATDKVAINEVVYAVASTEPLANVVKDATNKRVDMGITNDSGNPYLIRFFTYMEG